MGNFKGWMVKFGDMVLPNNYLEKYQDTPNQRLEIDAYRDSGKLYLHRTTSPYFKSKITLPIKRLYYGEKILLKAIIDAAVINEAERKVQVTYWNSENLDYVSGEFYISDIEYTVTNVNEDRLNMVYEPFSIVLTEY